jgi:pyridoxal phosphate enzyme (YggS family)
MVEIMTVSETPTRESFDEAGDVKARLDDVYRRIADAERAGGRQPGSVTLVAISKTHPRERAAEAIAAGHRVFGENRVQEAMAKWPELKEGTPGLKLHLVGPLQTNKARDAVELFDVVETLDRPKLAAALAREMDRLGRKLDCFVQVNTGEEPQKAGVLPEHADAFIDACRRDYQLPVVGLMCIPPVDEEPALHFALLGEIAKRNGLAQLSMGMSADYETAIRFGATHVRIGTAIFGPRPQN